MDVIIIGKVVFIFPFGNLLLIYYAKSFCNNFLLLDERLEAIHNYVDDCHENLSSLCKIFVRKIIFIIRTLVDLYIYRYLVFIHNSLFLICQIILSIQAHYLGYLCLLRECYQRISINYCG